jgi:hypothetical protein
MGEVERGRIGPIRPKRNLDQPASVAKIEEDQPAQISAAVNPAGQLDLSTLVIGAHAAQHPRAKCGPFDIDLVHGQKAVEEVPDVVVPSLGDCPTPRDGRENLENNSKPSITPALSATQSPTLTSRPGTKL